MSYDSHEQSTQDGRPKLRVLFAVGSVEYRYTNEEHIVADSDGAWIPAPIEFGEFSQTNEMAKDPLKIVLPRDNDVALLFLGGVPEQSTSVTVLRLHTNDVTEDYKLYWKGRVAGASATGDAVTLDCENIFTSMRRPGLRDRYQVGCRHVLYGRGCGLDKDDFGVAAMATAAAGFAVTITYSDSNDPAFVGGMLQTADGFYRDIIAHAGSSITLLRPLKSLEDAIALSGPQAVTVYPGCAHTISDCKDSFNNLLNYGGFPWIPQKNPFGNDVTGSIA